MLTDQEIIEIKRKTRALDPTQQWGDTLALSRAVIAAHEAKKAQAVPSWKPLTIQEQQREWADYINRCDSYDPPDRRHAFLAGLKRGRTLAAATPITEQAVPDIYINCETSDGVVTGCTSLNVVRVDLNDDGSFTAVTDHWPLRGASPPATDVGVVDFESACIGYARLDGNEYKLLSMRSTPLMTSGQVYPIYAFPYDLIEAHHAARAKEQG